jgi:hypothetical protein
MLQPPPMLLITSTFQKCGPLKGCTLSFTYNAHPSLLQNTLSTLCCMTLLLTSQTFHQQVKDFVNGTTIQCNLLAM